LAGEPEYTREGEQLASILIEMNCPQHGLERFTIKVIKRFNIASDEITPKLKIKPRQGQISRVYIGRNVKYDQVKDYISDYFDQRGMLQEIVRMRMLT
jgi:hypothetical protein